MSGCVVVAPRGMGREWVPTALLVQLYPGREFGILSFWSTWLAAAQEVAEALGLSVAADPRLQ